MKTLKTLLALSLLVSSFAPVCAMEADAAKVADANVDGVKKDEVKPEVKADDKKAEDKKEEAPKTFGAKVSAFVDPKAAAVKGFYAWNPEEKGKSLAKYGVTAAAVAAVIGGSYALYNYLFAGEESDEEVITEEPVAPVEEPVRTTVTEAPVAVAPVVRPATNNGGPRRGRNCRRGSKTSSARAKRCSKKSCRSNGCK